MDDTKHYPNNGDVFVPIGERGGGFNGKNAVIGTVIAGLVGVAAGALGKKLVNKVYSNYGYTARKNNKTMGVGETARNDDAYTPVARHRRRNAKRLYSKSNSDNQKTYTKQCPMDTDKYSSDKEFEAMEKRIESRLDEKVHDRLAEKEAEGEANSVVVDLKVDDGVLISVELKVEKSAEVVIPDNVISIGEYAFAGCSELTSVIIPNSVTSIEKFAFSKCTALTSIIIPDSVTSIGECAFSGCSALTSVIISNSVTSIRDGVFFDCVALENITIPDSVTNIKTAFSGCTALKIVTIPDSVIYLSAGAFNNCDTDLVIMASSGSCAEEHADLFEIRFDVF